jgi:hypothetical protein
MAMEYDDESELTNYVWRHYFHLMTYFEYRVGVALRLRLKGGAPAKHVLNKRYSGPEIDAALAEGPEAFRRRVCRRLLADRGGEVLINRCPGCGRVVRTPQARQCFWCGHDWHEAAV